MNFSCSNRDNSTLVNPIILQSEHKNIPRSDHQDTQTDNHATRVDQKVAPVISQAMQLPVQQATRCAISNLKYPLYARIDKPAPQCSIDISSLKIYRFSRRLKEPILLTHCNNSFVFDETGKKFSLTKGLRLHFPLYRESKWYLPTEAIVLKKVVRTLVDECYYNEDREFPETKRIFDFGNLCVYRFYENKFFLTTISLGYYGEFVVADVQIPTNDWGQKQNKTCGDYISVKQVIEMYEFELRYRIEKKAKAVGNATSNKAICCRRPIRNLDEALQKVISRFGYVAQK
jgi:hypothetical protein